MATNLDMYDYANIFNTYVDDDNFEYFNLLNGLYIENDIDASLYTTDYVHNLTSWYELSKKYYGTTKLWWIILVANNIRNPIDVKAGTSVKILKSSVVSEIISQINNS